MSAVLDMISNGCDNGGEYFRAHAVAASVEDLVVRALAGEPASNTPGR